MNKHFIYLMAIVASTFSFVSCDDDDDETDSTIVEEEEEEDSESTESEGESEDEGTEDDSTSDGLEDGSTLQGTITEDVTLSANNTYYLSGEYIVEEGACLYIEEGVTLISLYDDIVDYILIKQGAMINAVGTSTNPIVMTSEQEEPGAWGGIHICGKAPINVEGGEGYSEIGDAVYGGDDEEDNSGVLSYVRVEYTGYAFDEEHEANGITFYGVGNGTTVDHCEAYKGSDDGFEFFGGTVNISYMVVESCSDDSYDWTEGWTGTASDLVAFQEAEETLGYDCDCLIEADNNENNYDATPISHPTLSNLILVGNNSSNNKRGIRLRRGTEVDIDGAEITGKDNCVTLESEQTENALVDGTSSLLNIQADTELKSENEIYTNEMFEAAGNSTTSVISYSSMSDIESVCSWMTGWIK